MKKLTTLLLFVSIGACLCTAQEKYLSITGGYTLPRGNFSKSDLSNPESGYAQNGYNFSFEMTLFLNDFFGFGANLRFNNCNFNSYLFNKTLKEKFVDKVDTISLSSGNYNLHNFLVGPYIKLDIGDYITIYGKTFIGVISTYRPNQKLVYQYFGKNLITKETIGNIQDLLRIILVPEHWLNSAAS
jgi:hypothetical protein